MALASLECVPPPAVHGLGKPVIEVPGLTPTAPLMVVAPVQVTAAPPRTEKLVAEPRSGDVAAYALGGFVKNVMVRTTRGMKTRSKDANLILFVEQLCLFKNFIKIILCKTT